MGFNLVFEYGDIVIGIWFASFTVNLLPYASYFFHLVSLKKKYIIKGIFSSSCVQLVSASVHLYFILCI
jgi:hypothetical protein